MKKEPVETIPRMEGEQIKEKVRGSEFNDDMFDIL
jgi:hypothetical protein